MVERAALVAILDDDESIRRALQRLLRLSGYRVRTFSSAAPLLQLLPVDRPDCIVLDLHLPGMSGVVLLEHFSHLPDPPPVVVFTGYDDRLRDRCLALGAKDYIRKPLEVEGLLNAVRRIVPPTTLGSSPRRAIFPLLPTGLAEYLEPIGELFELCLTLV